MDQKAVHLGPKWQALRGEKLQGPVLVLAFPLGREALGRSPCRPSRRRRPEGVWGCPLVANGVSARAGLQLTAEPHGLCHAHGVQVRGVAAARPAWPGVPSLLPMVGTCLPAHF